MHRKDIEKIFKSVVIVSALSVSICMVGCGKQEEMPVMSEAVEEVAPVEEEEPVVEEEPATEEEPTEEEESLPDESEDAEDNYTITEMNEQMQATTEAKTYVNPNANEQKSAVQEGEIVTVIGKVDNSNWFMIEQSDGIQSFIDGVYLEAVTVTSDQQQVTQEPVQQQTPVQQEVQQEVQQPTGESDEDWSDFVPGETITSESGYKITGMDISIEEVQAASATFH